MRQCSYRLHRRSQVFVAVFTAVFVFVVAKSEKLNVNHYWVKGGIVVVVLDLISYYDDLHLASHFLNRSSLFDHFVHEHFSP